MKWLKSLFSIGRNKLKLKFNKQNNNWMVLREHEIVFMGAENECHTYLSNFQPSEG
jgi:hypothetical protein